MSDALDHPSPPTRPHEETESPQGMGSARPSRPQGFMRLVIWFILSLGVPCWLLHMSDARAGGAGEAAVPAGPTKGTGATTIDVKKTIAALQAAQPDYIGIGNSMLFSRLGHTPDEMSALTGKKFFFILKNGSTSAIWYLVLKNIVAASGVHPKLVFFFIRDNELTAPLPDSESNDSPFLKSLRGPEEPELDRLMGLTAGQNGNAVSLKHRFQDWFRFPGWTDRLPRALIDISMDIGGAGESKKAQRFALADRFSLDHLRGDLASDRPAADSDSGLALDPYNLPGSSCEESMAAAPLTEIMKVAANHSLKLLFFRVKRRPDADGNVANEPDAMKAYASRLKTVIEAQGGLFFDETYDPTIRLSDYLDGDHIRRERMDWYRRYFWERMAPMFP